MTSAGPSHTPIVRFLGEEAGQGGPFALLGLKHDIAINVQINRAVQRRLRQIDCHPHRSTPDADEVRLAIHSAASQLRDPTLREHLAQRWPEGNPIDLPKAWAPRRAMHKLTPGLVQHARRIVGSSGGWNPVARRRLAHLARVNRLGAFEVVRALSAGRASTTRSGTSEAPPQPVRLPSPPDAQRGWIGAYTVLGLLASTLVVTASLQPSRPTVQTATLDPASSPAIVPESGATGAFPETYARERLSHYTAIAHELDRLVARASTDPQGAAERFAEIYPRFLDRWTEFPLDALGRASVNIAELIVRLEDAGIPSQRLVPLLGSAGVSPGREMIAAAVVEVTLASTQLTSETRSGLRTLRERLSDAPITPAQSVRGSVVAIAEHLARTQTGDDPAWWEAWLGGAMHASGSDGRERDRLILGALGARLRADEPPGEGWFRVASMLVRSLAWRDGSDERFWLLEQFGDERVSTRRLAVLTKALVASSAAEGVDARMVLEGTANDPQREQMARSYQNAWFPPSPQSDTDSGGQDDLLSQLRVATTTIGTSIDDELALEVILDLTVLTLAAEMDHIGERLLSQELLQNPPQLREGSRAALDRLLNGNDEDNEWAQLAVNIDTAAQLRPLIDRLLARDALGINAAHALVYLATTKPEPELRELATAQLVRASEQPGVLLAIDHALSEDRVSSRLDDLVVAVLGDQLPARTSQDWFHEARLIVLARLGESLSRQRHTRFGLLQRELETLFAMRLGLDGSVAVPQNEGPAHMLGMLNQSKRLAMESDRARRQLEQADAAAIVMRRRAQSPLHAYSAELVYALDLKRIELAMRYAGITASLDRVEEERLARVRSAGSVLQQIVHTQRAIAQLWAIQMQRGSSS